MVVAGAALAGAHPAQDPPSTRTVNLTLTEGTSMAALASPDSRFIAIDLIGRLWILPSSGGEARQITPDLLEARQPTWSPDGRSLAFQGYGDDGNWHIYSVGADGNNLKTLTRGIFDDREPAWSPDGRQIAFSSDRFGGITTIWTLTVASGETAQISSRDGWMPSWSPEDRALYFLSADIARTSQDASPASRPRPGIYRVDAMGRDRLAFDATMTGLPSAFAVRPGQHERAAPLFGMTGGGGVATSLSVSGRTISSRAEDVFPLRPQWLSESELLYTADGHIKRRRVGEGEQPAGTIPFSARVALQRPTYTIAHRALDPIEPQRAAGIVSPVVSPDGRLIAFVALGDLFVLPVGSGAPIQLTDDGFAKSDLAWSPDGTELAFSTDRDGTMNIWVRNFTKNDDRQITFSRGGAAISGAAWSPDGTHVAYLVNRASLGIVRVRPGGGNLVVGPRPLAQPGELGRPTWSGDSLSVAVGALFPFSNRYREGLNQLLIQQLDPQGWSASLIYPEHSAGNRQSQGPVWAPDGLHMAFVSEGQLFVEPVSASGLASGPPAPIADDEPDSPSWEGNSRHLVYLTPRGFRRVLADGGPPETIACDLGWKAVAPPDRIVVHAGRVFDGTYDGLSVARDIVIEHGVIQEVADHRDDLHTGAVVDASDEVVMPGLIDMHTHLDPDYGESLGRIWLAYGVTSVRNPSQNPYIGLEMREAFDAGRRVGPRVFLSGQAFDGPRVFYPGYMTIASPQHLARALEAASQFGVDFFKTYVRLPDRFQQSVTEYAHTVARLPVTSHELYPGAAFGVDGVEHLRGTSRRGYSPKVSSANRSYQDVVDTIVKGGMSITPTIGIQGAFDETLRHDQMVASDPRLALFPLTVAVRVAGLPNEAPLPPAAAALKPYAATARAIAAAGGLVIAGTDSPLIPYGLSLHVELQTFVDGGMTPYQALQTATGNAARALGVADQLGTIEPGKLADLTFIGGDPLVDIRNTRDVRRVMRSGRLYTLQQLLGR